MTSRLARALLTIAALALPAQALAQEAGETPVVPMLRASVTVTTDLVRIGDFIDNAGNAAAIAVFRAPDIGTTGTLSAARVVAALRAHQVIGVDTRDIREVTVTRAARTIAVADIEALVARTLARQNGLGDAANLAILFDRIMQPLQLDPSHEGEMRPVYAKYDPRSTRFDVMVEIASTQSATPTRLRFAGTAVEMTEVAVVNRGVERGEVLKASDVSLQRRPRAEAGGDLAPTSRAVGMAMRRSLRAGQALKFADLAKPEIVQRDQSVTLVYDIPGIHLTIMGKATESGAEGDVVSVMNLQSKRIVQGTVSAPGRVTMSAPRATTTALLSSSESAADGRAAE
ncbi:MAG: flagellar basal body P-ring formation protein FlgA [Xanthobacteraceae bacterium]|nr:MAG: flagellar basal body P-ring formation protein FlgA [Xanthobacteraceae bacterium]